MSAKNIFGAFARSLATGAGHAVGYRVGAIGTQGVLIGVAALLQKAQKAKQLPTSDGYKTLEYREISDAELAARQEKK